MGEPHADQPVPTQSEHIPFQKLLRQLAEGSAAAERELCERYSKNILRTARRHLPSSIRSKIDSLDIMQSVWKSLLRKGSTLIEFQDGDRFMAYVTAMAKKKAMEQHRRFTRVEKSNIGREVQLGDLVGKHKTYVTAELALAHSDSPAEIASAGDQLASAIAKGGQPAAAIVDLKLKRKTLDEIAAEIGISKKAVRQIITSLVTSLADGEWNENADG